MKLDIIRTLTLLLTIIKKKKTLECDNLKTVITIHQPTTLLLTALPYKIHLKQFVITKFRTKIITLLSSLSNKMFLVVLSSPTTKTYIYIPGIYIYNPQIKPTTVFSLFSSPGHYSLVLHLFTIYFLDTLAMLTLRQLVTSYLLPFLNQF